MPYSGGSMSQWSPPFIGGAHGQELHHWRNVRVAMEPAVYRREHDARLEQGPPGRRVAMEPAVYRREHRVRPAWRRDPEHHVAMEPAVYRREHHVKALDSLCLLRVAMEPAVYRREHRFSARSGLHSKRASQWSPPFIGGSTSRRHPARPVAHQVAMEPAVYRREHFGPYLAHHHARAEVAMEPAVYRREHTATAGQTRSLWASQWSPPFIGEST